MAATTAVNGTTRPLLRAIVLIFFLGCLTVVVFVLRFGRETGFSAAPVIVPMAHGFFAIGALTICFLAFGRYRVLRDPVSFWIGTAFASSSVILAVYVCSFPVNLPHGGQFIALLPGPPAWILAVAQMVFCLLILPAAVERQPLKLEKEGPAWILFVIAIVCASAILSAIVILAGRNLPVLVTASGSFTPAIYQLNAIPLLLMAGATAVSLRGYLRSGEPLHGYTTICQIFFLFAYAVFFLSVRRYDLWWCCSRLFSVGACASMLLGLLSGYVTLYRRELETTRALQRTIDDLNLSEGELRARAHDLAIANEELESFSFSVSHDLRTQLHILTAFAYLLKEEFGEKLGEVGDDYLLRIAKSVDFMNTVIESILKLSRISRHELSLTQVNIGALAAALIEELRHEEPDRAVEAVIHDHLSAVADESLITVTLANLIRNAWKFSGKKATALIEIGSEQKNGQRVFFVRDNGAGFDMIDAEKIFKPFKRLHPEGDFPGSGIGLAIVSRAVKRHGGRVWAEAKVDAGACFYFTLPPPERGDRILPSGTTDGPA
jgi:signal transduction histidine kinase